MRGDFPILDQLIQDKPLVYLDNAATTQKPKQVIDAIRTFYESSYGTVHRGLYHLSQQSTQVYDSVRKKVKTFLNAKTSDEIVFVKGTTDAINLLAHGLVKTYLKKGDRMLISAIEHHANWVPWYELSKSVGFDIDIIPVLDDGSLDLNAFEALLQSHPKLLAIGHVSNALGTIHPIKDMIQQAHDVGALVLVDGAQAVSHFPIDVQALDCDFYCFSSHKLYGPTGVGVLYGKYDLLTMLPPYQMGGDMIESVTLDDISYAKPPLKFEAGTPAIAQVMGLGAAIEYLLEIGFEHIIPYEAGLLEYATRKFQELSGVKIFGTADQKAGVISFVMDAVHPHDIGTILDEEGIAIRAGHHCSQPTMIRFGVAATARASFSFYNTTDEIDQLISGIQTVKEVMGCL